MCEDPSANALNTQQSRLTVIRHLHVDTIPAAGSEGRQKVLCVGRTRREPRGMHAQTAAWLRGAHG